MVLDFWMLEVLHGLKTVVCGSTCDIITFMTLVIGIIFRTKDGKKFSELIKSVKSIKNFVLKQKP